MFSKINLTLMQTSECSTTLKLLASCHTYRNTKAQNLRKIAIMSAKLWNSFEMWLYLQENFRSITSLPPIARIFLLNSCFMFFQSDSSADWSIHYEASSSITQQQPLLAFNGCVDILLDHLISMSTPLTKHIIAFSFRYYLYPFFQHVTSYMLFPMA